MKKNQASITLNLFNSKIIGLFIIFLILLCFISIQSCKNADKETETKGNIQDTTSASTTDEISIREYRLERQTMMDLESGQKKAKKLILKIHFDQLNSPSEMKLYYYPAKNAAHGGQNEIPVEIAPEGNPLVGVIDNIYIGNNELEFRDFKQGQNWLDFDYLILTPKKSIDNSNNLVLGIRPYKNNIEVKTFLNFPNESNPSPPAPPGN